MQSSVPSNRQESFLKLLMQVRGYAAFLLSPQGDIIAWSPGAEQLTGFTAPDVGDRHYSFLFAQADGTVALPAMELRSAVETGQADTRGWRRRKDGSLFWTDTSVVALHDDDGRLSGFGVLMREDDFLKSAEEDLGAARAEAEQRILDRFQ